MNPRMATEPNRRRGHVGSRGRVERRRLMRVLDVYPRTVRRAWPDWALLQAHNFYTTGRERDDLTVAMESEYQRRRRVQRVCREYRDAHRQAMPAAS